MGLPQNGRKIYHLLDMPSRAPRTFMGLSAILLTVEAMIGSILLLAALGSAFLQYPAAKRQMGAP